MYYNTYMYYTSVDCVEISDYFFFMRKKFSGKEAKGWAEAF